MQENEKSAAGGVAHTNANDSSSNDASPNPPVNHSSSTAPTTSDTPATAASPRPSSPRHSPSSSSSRWFLSWSVLFLCFAASIIVILSLAAALSSNYSSPLTLLQAFGARLGVGPTPHMSNLDLLPQRCEMSYFHLHHRQLPMTSISEASIKLIRGEISFQPLGSLTAPGSDDVSHATTPSIPPRRTRRIEPIEGEDEEDREQRLAFEAAEEAELAAEAAAAQAQAQAQAAARSKSSSATVTSSSAHSAGQTRLRDEFAAFRSIFLNSLPRRFVSTSTGRYKIYEYFDPLDPSSPSNSNSSEVRKGRVPVVFVPGSGGSFHQMRSLASRLNIMYRTSMDNNLLGPGTAELNDYYALDFLEESGAFNGRFLWAQSWYLNEALHAILRLYPEDTQIIVVAHSMGGIVARTAFGLVNHPCTTVNLPTNSSSNSNSTSTSFDSSPMTKSRVAMIVTLGTPHRHPVLLSDDFMTKMYFAANNGGQISSASSSLSTGQNETKTLIGPLTHLSPFFNSNASLHNLYASALHVHNSSSSLSSPSSSSSSSSSPLSALPFPLAPFMLSISGGSRDILIEPFLTDMHGIFPHTVEESGYILSVASHSIPYPRVPTESGMSASVASRVDVQRDKFGACTSNDDRVGWSSGFESVDHQCMCWCKQLVDTLAHSIVDTTRQLLKHLDTNSTTVKRKAISMEKQWLKRQRNMWLPDVLHPLRDIATLAGSVSREPDVEESRLPQTTLFESVLYLSNFTDKILDITLPPLSQWSKGTTSHGNGAHSYEGGILFVWSGLMRKVELCVTKARSSATNNKEQKEEDEHVSAPRPDAHKCMTLRPSLLAPQMLPGHRIMSIRQQDKERIGVASSYMLYIPASTLVSLSDHATIPPSSSSSVTLRFHASSSFLAQIRSLRPLRSGQLRQFGYGLSMHPSMIQQFDRSSPSASSSTSLLRNEAGVYWWNEMMEVGVERRMTFKLTQQDRGQQDLGIIDNEFAPPSMIAWFGGQEAEKELDQEHADFAGASPTNSTDVTSDAPLSPSTPLMSRSTFTDQLFSFYLSPLATDAGLTPSPTCDDLARTQTRKLHWHRSGIARRRIGLLIRIPYHDGLSSSAPPSSSSDSSSSSGPALTIHLTDDSYHSFLRTLFLQLVTSSPALVFGVALVLFGAQHDHQRKHGRFPRMFELLRWNGVHGPSVSLDDNIVKCVGGTIVVCLALWRGNLTDEYLLGRSSSTLSTSSSFDSEGVSMPWAHLLFRPPPPLMLRFCGVVLVFASLGLVVAFECLVYVILFGCHEAFDWVSQTLIKRFQRFFATSTQATPVNGSGSASSSPLASSSARSSIANLLRTLLATGLLTSFVLALIFSFSLAAFNMDFIGQVSGPRRAVHMLAEKVTSSLSRMLMSLAIMDTPFTFESTVRPFLQQWMCLSRTSLDVAELSVVVMVICMVVQIITFPSRSSRHDRLMSTSIIQRNQSATAYKSSTCCMMVLICGLLVGPRLFSAFRAASIHTNGDEEDDVDIRYYPLQGSKEFDRPVLIPPALAFNVTNHTATVPAAEDLGTDNIFLYPFILSSTTHIDLLSLLGLTWSILIFWSGFHVPFSPPVLQSVCMSAYGVLLALGWTSKHLLGLSWIVIVLCLCMLPHALASVLHVGHVLWEYIDPDWGFTEHNEALAREMEERIRIERCIAQVEDADKHEQRSNAQQRNHAARQSSSQQSTMRRRR